MKRTRFFLAIFIMVTALIAVGCKGKEEEPDREQKKRMEQRKFRENLLSYHSDFGLFLSRVVGDISIKEEVSLGMLKLEKGMEITYKKEIEPSRIEVSSLIKGKLPYDTYCLYKDGKTFLMDGSIVTVHGKASVEYFTIKPFKEKWKKDELQPILKKHPLTVYIPMGNYNVPALKNYEEFVDIWDPDNDIVFYIREPRPDFIAWKKGEPYLIEKSGEFWEKRK